MSNIFLVFICQNKAIDFSVLIAQLSLLKFSTITISDT